ncbi:MAG: hypothetical protein ACI9PU_001741, partial [Ascidiaceihabitans sp.]
RLISFGSMGADTGLLELREFISRLPRIFAVHKKTRPKRRVRFCVAHKMAGLAENRRQHIQICLVT